MGPDPGFGLGGAAVVDRHLMALCRQMARHRIAHYTKAEECDFCHELSNCEGKEVGVFYVAENLARLPQGRKPNGVALVQAA
jgi:hypothetical protein